MKNTIKKIFVILLLVTGTVYSANAHFEMNISQVTGAPFCKGESFTVSFTIHFSFNAGNVYTAQLSNASGSFASPVSLGTLIGTGAGTITCQIPANTPEGTGYKIRIIASDPASIGDATTSVFVVGNNPTAVLNANGATTFCQGDSVALQTNSGAGYQYGWYRNNILEANNNSNIRYLKTGGSSHVVITDANGCTGTSNNISTVRRPKPIATVNPTGTVTLCIGDSLTLNANTGANLTYQWYKGVNTIVGATNPTYITKANGGHKVKVTNQYGCWKISPITKVVKVSCNKLGNSEETVLTASPVPFSNQLSLQLQDERLPATSITILDAQGREIWDKQMDEGDVMSRFEINTSDWSTGVYFVRYNNKDSQKTIKILKGE